MYWYTPKLNGELSCVETKWELVLSWLICDLNMKIFYLYKQSSDLNLSSFLGVAQFMQKSNEIWNASLRHEKANFDEDGSTVKFSIILHCQS